MSSRETVSHSVLDHMQPDTDMLRLRVRRISQEIVKQVPADRDGRTEFRAFQHDHMLFDRREAFTLVTLTQPDSTAAQ